MSGPRQAEAGVESMEEFVRRVRADVDERLGRLTEPATGDDRPPERLVEAIRYSLLGGGKRFRPILVVATGEACLPAGDTGAVDTRDLLLDAACAIEMIHTFSLIHDDLPALDDDELRRGRPTLHVRFDEATAVLAGDALLNLAYEALAREASDPARRLRAIAAISGAVGMKGMISGQILDLEAEGVPIDPSRLRRIHAFKTGALIEACCEVGGIVAGAGDPQIARLREYGAHLGLAFQIVDDILDVEGSAEDLGKSPGKDAKALKATFPALWGLQESRRQAAECVERACAAVNAGGAGRLRGHHLESLARGVLTRRG